MTIYNIYFERNNIFLNTTISCKKNENVLFNENINNKCRHVLNVKV